MFKHLIHRTFVILLTVYLALGALLFIFQNKYIYHPDQRSLEDCPAFKKAEIISFASCRGYLTRRSPEKLIVFYHGNAGRACDREYMDFYFAQKNYSTFFVEYSGFAEKGNDPSMSKWLKNVDDTIAYLKTQNFSDVVVVGESIGVGPAAYHAERSSGIHKLILITAYNNIAAAAFSHYPVYPMRLLLLNNFTPDKWMAQYRGDVSFILAENDKVIPNQLGRKLYEIVPSTSKKIYIVKNAGHNSIYDTEDFYKYLMTALNYDP